MDHHTQTPQPTTTPWEYNMVQIDAPSTPECQEGVPSPGGQREEEHRVHHVQGEYHQ